jgi:hypothetical protein
MSERRTTDEALGGAIGRLDAWYPPTPSLAPGVIARLETDRASHARPPFPWVAILSRRRLLVLVTIGVLALLALAFGARFVLGATEVRVQPGVTPTGPPIRPAGLGEPLPIGRLSASLPFPLRLPPGPAPEGAYLVRTGSGDAALLVWRASGRYPAVPGTSWGLVLMEADSDAEFVLKNVDRFEDLRYVRVDGRRAFWIDAPHQLIVLTSDGAQTFAVDAGVLIWAEGRVTFRLETSLEPSAAIALAESMS